MMDDDLLGPLQHTILPTKRLWPDLWLKLNNAAHLLCNSWLRLHSEQAILITADRDLNHIRPTQLEPPV